MAEIILRTDNPSRFKPLGKNWVTTFIKRRPEIKSRFSRRHNYERAKCEDPRVIQTWFDQLQNSGNRPFSTCESARKVEYSPFNSYTSTEPWLYKFNSSDASYSKATVEIGFIDKGDAKAGIPQFLYAFKTPIPELF
ncbi:transposase [Aspergillus affinis]|uniref:transposase n=1 Tax=Aspergillus affinis TaxID=1070780 RepID=UPI0022FDE889|nr:transposase [Aspergillus affinis]KAI9040870.1 transposase [Aspergillus affinis]